MTTKQTTPYQLWDLSPVELPPRSRLYHLEPIGIGTAQVESLTSYLNRLARAHSVSARRLAMTEMRAVLESHYPAESVVTNTFGHINHTINGAGRSAIRAVLALEKLTLRNDLRFLTMWSWKVISAGSLLRSGRAWCPACYEQWRQAGQTLYEPLLWTLSVVTVCPQHHQRLVQQCPHQDCQATLPVLPPTGQSGYCSRCQGWLGVVSTEKEFVEPISSEQLWQANTVGELLVAAPSLPMPLPKERVAGIISKSVERGPTGSVYALSRMSGLPLDRLYAFLQETKALQLGLFLDTCYRLEISPLEYLIEPEMVENHCQIGAQEAASPYTLLEQDLSRFDFDQAQRVLTTLLANDEQPPSLREVARQLGQRENNLRRHFPELCQAIVEQRQQYQQAERLSLQPQLEAILANDKQLPLPLSEVAQRLECEPSFLQPRFPELCQAIAERHRTSQETEKLRLQRELETIVARNEIPPPFCSEVAQRLGQPTSTLQNRFPELCRIIIERHQHYHAAKRLRVRRELEAILANEDPPPSLSQVIARFDQTPPTFYHNYPELCQAIMERSQSYKAAEKLKTQGQLEAILASEEIPPPSLTEVAQRLEQSKNTLYSAFPELCQAIAEQGRQHWVREKLRMQHALAAALASEEAPPPSLAEMARQFACDRAVLQRNFPELCRMIVERRQQPQAAKKSKSQPQVAAILASEETPPPSLAEVARRLAYDKATFRRHFPEACQLIVERRQKYRAARKLRAQQALEAA
ncbi:MAG TPA: TniQ family protein, partial [Anaerolineae bacterium]|nr:TniQ family protein [Anaerolineae bacterium]